MLAQVADGAQTLQAIGGAVVAILGLLGLVAGGHAVIRSTAMKESFKLMGEANDELREIVVGQKAQYEADLAKVKADQSESEAKCREEIGELRGQITTMRSTWMRGFLTEIAEVAKQAVRTEIAKSLRAGPSAADGSN